MLYSFAGHASEDGSEPWAGVALDTSGALFGATYYGGIWNKGTAFSLSPPASAGGPWTETVLHSFGGRGGASPNAPLLIGGDGQLYSTTAGGGTSHNGTAFELIPPAAAERSQWANVVTHDFWGGTGDGAGPQAGIARGSAGVLYGTTYSGGTSNNGTVFSLTPPASQGVAWTETVLYNFAGGAGDGANPQGGVVIGPAGVLCGTTTGGGPANSGTVFSLAPPASPGGAWTETVLYSFAGASDGALPTSLTIGSDGVLYGTTVRGGTLDGPYCAPLGCGTVFSLAFVAQARGLPAASQTARAPFTDHPALPNN